MKKGYASPTEIFQTENHRKSYTSSPWRQDGMHLGGKKRKQLINELSPAPDSLLNTSLVHALNRKPIKK